MEFYEWLHDVTTLGYDENIMIPTEKGDIIKNLYELNYTPKEALQAYKDLVKADAQPVNTIDWVEDLTHENGNYKCTCGLCGRNFQGHKRRVRCKECSSAQPVKEGEKSQHDFIEDICCENGDNECKCDNCGVVFRGFKSRIACKKCISTPPVSKEVKTAEEILHDTCMIYTTMDWGDVQNDGGKEVTECVLAAMEAYHAQFATEAGGGKDAELLIKADKDTLPLDISIKDSIFEVRQLGDVIHFDLSQALRLSDFILNLNGNRTLIETLAAPSTHSSSEMGKGWISVKDRLPEHKPSNHIISTSQKVRIYDKTHGEDVAWLKVFLIDSTDRLSPEQVAGYWIFETTNMKYTTVTHWQPLGKPPVD